MSTLLQLWREITDRSPGAIEDGKTFLKIGGSDVMLLGCEIERACTPPAPPSIVQTLASGWHPITTAPKDREIWAFNGEQARMMWSEGPDWGLWIWADTLLSDADPSPEQPTHWMPLPDAPTDEVKNV